LRHAYQWLGLHDVNFIGGHVFYSELHRSVGLEKKPDHKKSSRKNILKKKNIFRYGELNPGLAGLMLCLRAADASHYTITDYVTFSQLINMIAIVNGTSTQP
jgi:hypothetical protein